MRTKFICYEEIYESFIKLVNHIQKEHGIDHPVDAAPNGMDDDYFEQVSDKIQELLRDFLEHYLG